MTHTMKDGTTVEDPRLGRLVYFDPASRDYPVARQAPRAAEPPATKTWEQPRGNRSWLSPRDQLSIGKCVADGIATCVSLLPDPLPRDLRAALTYDWTTRAYCTIQKRDPWAGTDARSVCGPLTESPTYGGTATLAGLLEYRNRGFFDGFSWAFGIDVACGALARYGPCVTGTWWTTGMASPDSNHRVRATGARLGGHLYCISGIDVTGHANWLDGDVIILNSHGLGYGDLGRARLPIRDWATLLEDDGECAFLDGKNPLASSLLPDVPGGRLG